MIKNIKLVCALCLALLLVITGIGVMGYMFRETDDTNAPLTPPSLSCTVEEQYASGVKSEIKVKNTGNINAYLRVRLVAYWLDADGNRVYREAQIPTFTLDSERWLADSANATYYFRTPVAPQSTTDDLLASDMVLASEDGYTLVVEVFAEAIQALPTDAASGAWDLEISADGKITDLK